MPEVTITNLSKAPQGYYEGGELKFVKAGETVEGALVTQTALDSLKEDAKHGIISVKVTDANAAAPVNVDELAPPASPGSAVGGPLDRDFNGFAGGSLPKDFTEHQTFLAKQGADVSLVALLTAEQASEYSQIFPGAPKFVKAAEKAAEPVAEKVTEPTPEPIKQPETPAPVVDAAAIDAMTDDQLHAFIEDKTGRKAHSAMTHDNLVAKAKTLLTAEQ